MLQRSSQSLARAACQRSQCLAASRTAARRTFLTRSRATRATNDLNLNKLRGDRRDYEHNRTAFLAAGAVAGVISFIYTAWKLKQALDERAKGGDNFKGARLDSPLDAETFKTEAGEKRKNILHDENGKEIVPTGNGTVPFFPRLLDVTLPTAPTQQQSANPIAASIDDSDGTQFTLVGLGMRTVTFIGIQVYLVGFYVATQDVEKLQHYLVKKVNPLATTLIPSEKDTLRKSLKDATEGEETWNDILRDSGCRSVFRIIPVRDTDFHHLRDGFVRAITDRSKGIAQYSDEAFGAAVRGFKDMFNRGSVPKKKEMLLCRDAAGKLSVMYSSGQKEALETLGTVDDERVSRLLWLNYLAGNKVASKEARENIIEGVMEFVERPVGTVATQVI
ncbi:chalcone isomerase like domain-containing protein [Sarocladium implicatum]|nr:chalcone isomerase like domain-containing protein [Sarocladium implicatum]